MAGMVVIEGGKGVEKPVSANANGAVSEKSGGKPSAAQLRYLKMGAKQPGGKLPLFDEQGQEIRPATIKSCVEKGWAEPWFHNPLKPDWLVCRLTDDGRKVLGS